MRAQCRPMPIAVMLTMVAAVSIPAAARERRPKPAPAQTEPPLDDLYRRRGYGMGGPIFGGDTAMAGSCAGLRFAEPDTCGRGFGIYGNGLGSRFGF